MEIFTIFKAIPFFENEGLHLLAQLGNENFFEAFKRDTESITLSMPITIVLGIIVLAGVCLVIYHSARSKEFEKIEKIKPGRVGEYYLESSDKSKTRPEIPLEDIIRLYVQDPDCVEVLTELMESSDADPEEVCESSFRFEQVLDEYIEFKKPKKEIVEKLPTTRKALNYYITNPDVRFSHTRQIPEGYKMRASFPGHRKQLSFVTMPIASGVKKFAILPPKVKGTPADISGFKEVEIHLNDGKGDEFMFRTQILKQTTSEKKFAVLAHTSDILSLIKRKSKRYPVSLEVDMMPEKSNTHSSRLIHYSAQVIDIGNGGMLAYFREDELSSVDKEMIFRFDFSPAEMTGVEATPRKIESKDGKIFVHLRFKKLSSLNQVLLDRYLGTLEEKAMSNGEGENIS